MCLKWTQKYISNFLLRPTVVYKPFKLFSRLGYLCVGVVLFVRRNAQNSLITHTRRRSNNNSDMDEGREEEIHNIATTEKYRTSLHTNKYIFKHTVVSVKICRYFMFVRLSIYMSEISVNMYVCSSVRPSVLFLHYDQS